MAKYQADKNTVILFYEKTYTVQQFANAFTGGDISDAIGAMSILLNEGKATLYEQDLKNDMNSINSYSKDGFDNDGFDLEGYNRNGFDIYGIHRNGTLYDNNGYDKNGNLLGNECVRNYFNEYYEWKKQHSSLMHIVFGTKRYENAYKESKNPDSKTYKLIPFFNYFMDLLYKSVLYIRLQDTSDHNVQQSFRVIYFGLYLDDKEDYSDFLRVCNHLMSESSGFYQDEFAKFVSYMISKDVVGNKLVTEIKPQFTIKKYRYEQLCSKFENLGSSDYLEYRAKMMFR